MRVLLARDGEVVAWGETTDPVTWLDVSQEPDGAPAGRRATASSSARRASAWRGAAARSIPAGTTSTSARVPRPAPPSATSPAPGRRPPARRRTGRRPPRRLPHRRRAPPDGSTVRFAYRTDDGGWLLDVLVDGDDALSRALSLLPEPVLDSLDPVSGGWLTTSGDWYVDVDPNEFEGHPGLTYRLRPAG